MPEQLEPSLYSRSFRLTVARLLSLELRFSRVVPSTVGSVKPGFPASIASALTLTLALLRLGLCIDSGQMIVVVATATRTIFFSLASNACTAVSAKLWAVIRSKSG